MNWFRLRDAMGLASIALLVSANGCAPLSGDDPSAAESTAASHNATTAGPPGPPPTCPAGARPYILAEAWTPNLFWIFRVPRADRERFMDHVVNESIPALAGLGVESLGIADVTAYDRDPAHVTNPIQQRYMALWRLPCREMADFFEAAVRADGWYDRFYQQNVRGAVMSVDEFRSAMINAPGGGH
jgi:hypothetical protein